MDLLVVIDYSGQEAAPVEVPEPPTLLGRRLERAPSTPRIGRALAEPVATTCLQRPASHDTGLSCGLTGEVLLGH